MRFPAKPQGSDITDLTLSNRAQKLHFLYLQKHGGVALRNGPVLRHVICLGSKSIIRLWFSFVYQRMRGYAPSMICSSIWPRLNMTSESNSGSEERNCQGSALEAVAGSQGGLLPRRPFAAGHLPVGADLWAHEISVQPIKA